LVLPRNTPNAIRYTILALVITNWAMFARFVAGYILELTGVTFGTICSRGTTIHFVTGGAHLAQL
jgi:ABC-type dipeptide/oligopeptide/nickel transport system permease subunit